MKITKEADYALRIVTMLCKEQKQIEAKTIAEKSDIPYRFTLKILRKIVNSGIIKSCRGVNGGYMINRRPEDITFREIIEIIDGRIAINKCLNDPEVCKNSEICRMRSKLYSVQNIVSEELGKITFADIVEK